MGKLSIFQTQTEDQVSFPLKSNLEYTPETQYYLGIRPENIEILADDSLFFGNKLNGTVFLSENLGGEGFVHVALKDGAQIIVKSKKVIADPIGSSVRFGFSFENCYLFDENGNTLLGIESPSPR
jgi:ABC-type sugar transport system ATPase subunit